MAAHRWRRQLGGVILVALLCTAGCNPQMLAYILEAGSEPMHDPDFPLTSKDAKKKDPVKVVILTSAPLETREELMGVDRELSQLVSRFLSEGCQRNKENVLVASNSKIQKFKDDHPNWKSLSLDDIGKQFNADYVIDLEINNITLYQEGSRNTLFRGRAEISITVADIHRPGDDPIFQKEYTTLYPGARGEVPVSDTNLDKFRRDFLIKVATELSWYFTAHPIEDDYRCD